MKTKFFKRTIAGVLLLALMVSFIPAFPILAAESDGETGLVSFTSPAIPATTGDVLDLSLYQVQFIENGTYLSEIAWTSEDLVVNANTVTAPDAGVYELTASSGSFSKSVYLVVKNPEDTEYVLYENTFENGDDVSQWWKRTNNESFSVSDGVLTLDTAKTQDYYVMTGMPDYLRAFGDYHITVDAKMTAQSSDSMWMAVVFRNQGEGYDPVNNPTDSVMYYNYDQVSIRKSGATEIIGRKDNGFLTATKGALSEALDPDTFYSLDILAQATQLSFSIDGTQVGTAESLSGFTTGGIGFLARGCTAVFDNLKVTLITDGATLTTDSEPADHAEVSFVSPAIPANSGSTLDLSKYYVQFTQDGEYLSNITWTSQVLTVQADKVAAPAAGVYPLTATSGELSKTVYLVVKNPTDSEYVLYENCFDNADEVSQWYQAKTDGKESYSVSNGELTLDSQTSGSYYMMVGMPDWLSDFGDYHISVDAKMTKAANTRRWMSIVFRNQGDPANYDVETAPTGTEMMANHYHSAIRQDGEGEVTGRTGTKFQSSWAKVGNYSTALDANTFYRMSLHASGSEVSFYVNDIPISATDSFTHYSVGGIGLHNNGCASVFDNLKVTLITDGIIFTTAPISDGSSVPVSFTSPAIPTNRGDILDLSRYQVQFVQDGEYLSNLTWSSEELTISDNTVSAPLAGTYRLTASSGELSKTIYLVAKKPADTEYVLYQNSFNSADEVFQWYQAKTDGKETYSVSNGVLTMDTTAGNGYYLMVGMPDWLSDFGDYHISLDAKITKSSATDRWMSIVFRDQGDPSQYNVTGAPTGKEMYKNHYQAAIRRNGGCEITGRKNGSFQSDDWCVKENYSSALTLNTFYSLDLFAKGSEVAFYVNGEQTGYTDTFTHFRTGGIGLHNNGCISVFDNLQVTLIAENETLTPYTDYTRVQDADTGITLAPSVITNGSADYDALIDSGASAAIYEVGDALAVTTGGTVADVVNGLNRKVIPIFRVSNTTHATAVAEELAALNFSDAFILSADGDTVLAARTANSLLYGVLDLSDQSELDLVQARAQANASLCRVVLLPASLASRENVEALQELFITVWVVGGTSAADHAKSVTTGAHGIVTSDVSGLLSLMKEHFPANSVVRTVQIIAHRGMPNIYPENSLAGAKYAYEMGATQIENDVRLTSDGVLVVIHDEKINRTANGTGTVASMTYEELSQYYLLNPDGTTSTEKIPTLEEYFLEFKDKDVKIVVEIKTKDAATISAIAELVAQYDILDQINFITFYEAQIAKIGELMPGASCGYLTSNISIAESDSTYSAEKVLTTVQPYGSTFNPDYLDDIGNNTLQALLYRGMTVWPYTIKSKSVFDTLFLAGLSGMTVNDSNWVTDMTRTVSAPAQISFKLGRSSDLNISALTYGKASSAVTDAQMILIEGNDTVTYANGTVTATKKGTATVMFRITEVLPNGSEFYLYTEPTTIEVLPPDAQWVGYQTTTERSAEKSDGTSYQAFNLRLLAVVNNPDDSIKAFDFIITLGNNVTSVRSYMISTEVTAYTGGAQQKISATDYGGTHFAFVHITGIPADGTCPQFTVTVCTRYQDGSDPTLDTPYQFTPTAYSNEE